MTLLACKSSEINSRMTYENHTSDSAMKYIDKINTEVDELLKQDLVESARNLIHEQIEYAKEESWAQLQLVMYGRLEGFSPTATEVGELAQFFQKEADQADAIIQPILYSMAGSIYSNYAYQNRWRTSNQKTSGSNDDPVELWSNKRVLDSAILCYEKSLLNPDLTFAINSEDFEPVFKPGHPQTRVDRPSIYDFLVHQVIQFHDDIDYEYLPGDNFNLKSDDLLNSPEAFISIDWEGKISSDPLSRIPYLYQDLLKRHQASNNTSAFLALELDRLYWAVSLFPEKDFENLLLELQGRAIQYPVYPAIAHARARSIWNGAQKASLSDPVSLEDNTALRALEILEEALEKHPEGHGAEKCRALKAEIETPSLEINTRSVNYSKEEFLASLQYRNLQGIGWRIYSIPEKQNQRINTYSEYERIFKEENPVQTGQVELPKNEDYLLHRIEIPLPALNSGDYLLLIQDKDADQSIFSNWARTNFQVSTLNYFVQENGDAFDIHVKNRRSGLAVPGARIDLKSRQGDVSLETDEQGIARLDSRVRGSFEMLVRHGDEQLRHRLNAHGSTDFPERENQRVFFYTDRAIYRPGQEISFKVLVANYLDDMPSQVAAGQKIEVKLMGPNYEELDALTLSCNGMGSASGSFVAKGYLGSQTLRAEGFIGQQYINVEEYKRPTFEVLLPEAEEQFRLDEQVQLKGQVLSLSGVPLANSGINYKVYRGSWDPWWCFSYTNDIGFRPYPDFSNEMLILEQTTSSDDLGNFDVDFEALASKSDPSYRQFRFRVEVEATDPSGETRVAHQTIRLSRRSFDIRSTWPDQIDRSAGIQENILVNNVMGKPVDQPVTVRIKRVGKLEEVKIPRMWEDPDQFLLSKDEFQKRFPRQYYSDEHLVSKREQLRALYEKDSKNADDREIELISDLIKDWDPGEYVLEVFAYDAEELIQYKKYFTLYDSKSSSLPVQDGVWLDGIKNAYQPGEVVSYRIGAAKSDSPLKLVIKHGEDILEQKDLNATGQIEEFEFPVKESHRGGLQFYLIQLYNDQTFEKKIPVDVEWTNRQLDLSWINQGAFYYPGSHQKFSIQVEGNQSKVPSELMVTIYDAALEFYAPYYSQTPSFPLTRMQGAFASDNRTMVAGRWSNEPTPSFYYKPEQLYDLLRYGTYSARPPYLRAQMRNGTGAVLLGQAEAGNVGFSDAVGDIKLDPFAKDDFETGGSLIGLIADSEIEDGNRAEPEIRSDMRETAYFGALLPVPEDGIVDFDVELPDALTRWQLEALAHSKDLSSGKLSVDFQTRKELMVNPNLPRYLREGDRVELKMRVDNQSEEDLVLQTSIDFLSASEKENLNDLFELSPGVEKQSIGSKGNTEVSWWITVPEYTGEVDIILSADAGQYQDAEQNTLPVLSARKQFIQQQNLFLRPGDDGQFDLSDLIPQNASAELIDAAFTFSPNPVWSVAQALPYLKDFPQDCSEQLYSKIYANQVSRYVAENNPDLINQIKKWAEENALNSPLQENSNIKLIALEESPWLIDAESEEDRMQRVAELLSGDFAEQQLTLVRNLLEKQNSSGAWPWFAGGYDNQTITTHIVSGFYQLKKDGFWNYSENTELANAIQNARGYLESRLIDRYQRLTESEKESDRIGQFDLHLLYCLSLESNPEQSGDLKAAWNYYLKKLPASWQKQSPYYKALSALTLNLNEDSGNAEAVLASLDEYASRSEHLGMYWDHNWSWGWYSRAAESQSLLIRAYKSVRGDDAANDINEMLLYLLQQKRTRSWDNTKATAEACAAILLSSSWDFNFPEWDYQLAGIDLEIRDEDIMGGRISKEIPVQKLKENPSLSISSEIDRVAWGGVHLRYSDQMDQVESSSNEFGLRITKQLHKRNPDLNRWDPISDRESVAQGEKILIRLQIDNDQDLEFVFLKDALASGMESGIKLSGWQWSNQLSYYQSTKDASQQFFFDYLPQGSFVIEYEVFASQKGDFSLGSAEIQCLYAPEFGARSKGSRLQID
jgi:uncharacterized protein YfaS (alpha-2-macroglobulin family)